MPDENIVFLKFKTMKIKKDDHKEKEQRKQKGHSFYIDLMNDYGFKRIFGRPEGMALLLDMLKTFLPDEFRRIRKIELLPTEQLGDTEDNKRVIFDLLCTDGRGNKTIVEMQRETQKFYAERALTYNSRMISRSVKRGNRRYKIPTVIGFTILEHTLPGFEQSDEFFHVFRYQDAGGRLLTGKSVICFLELGKFARLKATQIRDLRFSDKKEKWAFLIKHMHHLEEQDVSGEEPVFRELLDECRYSGLDNSEKADYERSVLDYDDVQNAIEYAAEKSGAENFEKGRQEGIEQGIEQGIEKGIEQGMRKGIEQGLQKGLAHGRKELIRSMVAKGLDNVMISEIAGITEEEVASIAMAT